MSLNRLIPRTLLMLVILVVTLAACGGDSSVPEDERSFAPEAQGDVALPTDTPAPTSTFAPIDHQPGEDDSSGTDVASLLGQRGPAAAILSGLTSYLNVMVETGVSTEVLAPRSSTIAVSISPNGQHVVVLDRSGAVPVLKLLDGAGKERANWSPSGSATPGASPVASSSVAQLADRIAWSTDSAQLAIWISDVGLLLADNNLNVQRLEQPDFGSVTALAFSPSGQSLAIGTWNSVDNSSSILSLSTANPDAAPGTLLRTSVDDGRYIRSMVWGNEQVGIVFALRDAGSSSSLPNDLYRVVRFGEPMRLVASAGAAAPAALIDQVAIAADGQTVAYSVLIPADSGYRLHSLWIADALSARPVELNLNGIRRIGELAWSTSGLVATGYTRTSEDGAGYVNSVIELFNVDGSQQTVTEKSAATPAASPVAEPDGSSANGTPEA